MLIAAPRGGPGGDHTIAQIKGRSRPAGVSSMEQRIPPISRESYYNAIECGKQGGG